MAAASRRLIVFSDLDGTLLDKQTYSWGPAAPALQTLAERGVPLILASSKTLPEMLEIRQALGNDDPFIFENGAGVALPPGTFPHAADVMERDGLRVKLFGADRGRILDSLRRRRASGDRFQSFSDWSIEQLQSATGLDQHAAALAQDRMATEPLAWRDSPGKLQEFEKALSGDGIRLVKGGRFWCAMGQFDKGHAVRWLDGLYRKDTDANTTTIALGDSPNDEGMLSQVDVAVVVRSDNSDQLQLNGRPRVVRTEARGPEGWNKAVAELLIELEDN